MPSPAMEAAERGKCRYAVLRYGSSSVGVLLPVGIWKWLAWGLEAAMPVFPGEPLGTASLRPAGLPVPHSMQCCWCEQGCGGSCYHWPIGHPRGSGAGVAGSCGPTVPTRHPVTSRSLQRLLQLAGRVGRSPDGPTPLLDSRGRKPGPCPRAESHFCQCDQPSGWVSTGAHSIWGSPQPACPTLNLNQREGKNCWSMQPALFQ